MFDFHYMKQALKEAEIGFSKGEIPVGAVVVNRLTKKIISSAHNMVQNKSNALLHAEIIVLQESMSKMEAKYLQNCDLYVTLEPCTMCAAAISYAKIKNLFYGADDIKQGAVENGIRFFRTTNSFHKPQVFSNILEKESSQLLKEFFLPLR